VLPLLSKHSLSIGKGYPAVWLPYAHRIRISTPLYIIVSTQNPGPDFNLNFISWSRLLWHCCKTPRCRLAIPRETNRLLRQLAALACTSLSLATQTPIRRMERQDETLHWINLDMSEVVSLWLCIISWQSSTRPTDLPSFAVPTRACYRPLLLDVVPHSSKRQRRTQAYCNHQMVHCRYATVLSSSVRCWTHPDSRAPR
jgi:hypothetical protein